MAAEPDRGQGAAGDAERVSDGDGLDAPFGLFEAVGVELEYMVVDVDGLRVRPIVDEVIAAELGEVR